MDFIDDQNLHARQINKKSLSSPYICRLADWRQNLEGILTGLKYSGLLRFLRIPGTLLLPFLMPFLGMGQGEKELAATFSENPLRIDGVLNETGWEKAEKTGNFTQRELNEGAPATEKTRAAVLYTKQALIIGAWCFDSEPERITARELKRDFNHQRDDDFEVILDTYNDDRNGFLFITNPLGARRDAQVFDNGQGRGGNNVNWDGVWEVATTRTDSGWFAEIRIPFSTLTFAENGNKCFGRDGAGIIPWSK